MHGMEVLLPEALGEGHLLLFLSLLHYGCTRLLLVLAALSVLALPLLQNFFPIARKLA